MYFLMDEFQHTYITNEKKYINVNLGFKWLVTLQ